MFKITNVTDRRTRRGTADIVPRAWYGAGVRLEPGEHTFVEEVEWAIQLQDRDHLHGPIEVVEWDPEANAPATQVAAAGTAEPAEPTATVAPTPAEPTPAAASEEPARPRARRTRRTASEPTQEGQERQERQEGSAS